MEEPPSKVSKFEISEQYLEGEVMEETQEEWLSEGILTDEDYNTSSQQANLDQTDANTTQDQAVGSVVSNCQDMLDDNGSNSILEQHHSMMETSQDGLIDTSQDGLDTSQEGLDTSQEGLDTSQEGLDTSQEGLDTSQDGLDASQALDNSAELNVSTQNLNDTTGVLENSAELQNSAVDIEETLNSLENAQNNQSQDFPEELGTYLIRKTNTQTVAVEYKVQKNEPQTQAEDDGNDTDDLLRVLGDGDQKDKDHVKGDPKDGASSDDDEYIFKGAKLKNYEIAKNALMRASAAKAEPEDCSTDEESTMRKMFNIQNKTTKSTKVIKTDLSQSKVYNQSQGQNRPIIKKVINVIHRPKAVQTKTPQQPLKQYENKNYGTSLLRPIKNDTKDGKLRVEPLEQRGRDKKTEEKEDSAPNKANQHLMKPEEMDEDVPTDGESNTDDEESIYDELPSSDSEGHEDWFTLDIRAERAGDYIPLLGDRAFQLLTEEKHRVAARLDTLKKSLSGLTQSGKEQAEKLREATSTVAELDALLKAV